jgi:hypothetical protein
MKGTRSPYHNRSHHKRMYFIHPFMMRPSSTTCKFLEKCLKTSKKSQVYLQCDHSMRKWAKFGECQIRGVKKSSCQIVAHRGNFVDRPESYDSFRAKNCIFLALEKTRTLGVYFSIPIHNLTQSKVSKNAQDIFLLLSTLVRSLTLQISDIVQSSLESPTLEFSLIICYIRDLDVWSRGKGKSNFVRLVMVRK